MSIKHDMVYLLWIQKNSVDMILREEHPELLMGGKCLKLVHRQANTQSPRNAGTTHGLQTGPPGIRSTSDSSNNGESCSVSPALATELHQEGIPRQSQGA